MSSRSNIKPPRGTSSTKRTKGKRQYTTVDPTEFNWTVSTDGGLVLGLPPVSTRRTSTRPTDINQITTDMGDMNLDSTVISQGKKESELTGEPSTQRSKSKPRRMSFDWADDVQERVDLKEDANIVDPSIRRLDKDFPLHSPRPSRQLSLVIDELHGKVENGELGPEQDEVEGSGDEMERGIYSSEEYDQMIENDYADPSGYDQSYVSMNPGFMYNSPQHVDLQWSTNGPGYGSMNQHEYYSDPYGQPQTSYASQMWPVPVPNFGYYSNPSLSGQTQSTSQSQRKSLRADAPEFKPGQTHGGK
ncbi:hypothetical protein M231_06965 [Tremella mesenterica]|uniref:Uncharacterized protein n=1 Tax=Tremella mesenterica TaxID=5217 RepID=A0A4Q1BAH4_TREME|nr:hypothetical protein M231_06965 [Tremella mesenterica]